MAADEQAGPAIILVEPQLGENIGMAARAMANCALTDLRLVRPRDGWPNPDADAAAAGADAVLTAARLYDGTAEAVADLSRVYATTVRTRGMVKPAVTPRRAAEEMRAGAAAGERAGVLFGPERAGLANDDVALADAVLRAPLNPAFVSLNLAQAVLLVGYEWYLQASSAPERRLEKGGAKAAPRAELENFFQRLEAALDAAGYFRQAERKPMMRRSIRAIFTRAGLTEQEVNTLHGIVSALVSGGHKTPRSGR